jgi:putative ABC transport system substrate-binding protein
MRRRDFILLVGAMGMAATRASQAQPPGLPVVGFLHSGTPEGRAHLEQAFRKGLAETGYVEGRNVAIENRWAHNDAKKFSELADDLVRRRVAVIVTPNGTAMALAAKAATVTIPIVFSIGTDAIKAGLIPSYNRPGGNVTGIAAMVSELGAKRLGLLLELRPQAKRIGLLVNPTNPVVAEESIKDVRAAASASGLDVEVLNATNPREIDAAFAALVQKQADGLVVSPDPLVGNRRIQLATLAARHALAAVYPMREFAEAGGLMSYGPNDAERNRLLGVYAGRVLKGEKPADMPVQQPTTFEFVINLQTARTLGIAVPPTLIARADEVIE